MDDHDSFMFIEDLSRVLGGNNAPIEEPLPDTISTPNDNEGDGGGLGGGSDLSGGGTEM